MTAASVEAVRAGGDAPLRMAGLEGLRGVGALVVVFYHCWLLSFVIWSSPPVYADLPVAMFIVLSGFSLAVVPAWKGWRLTSRRRFLLRRAWRILPPYWPALLLSLLIAWTLVPQPGQGTPTLKSVVVFGLLLHDVFGAPSPNGPFWSIAVEVQLYVVLPILLWLVRRVGGLAMVGVVLAPAVAIAVLAPTVPFVGLFMRFIPQFAVLFAVGVLAAGLLVDGGSARLIPSLPWLSLAAAMPAMLLIVLNPAGINGRFWVDLAIGPAIALLVVSIATGRPATMVRLLESRPMTALGSFSYSLYLTHAPLIVVMYHYVVAPNFSRGLPAFLAMLGLAVPAALFFARAFAAIFELPFQRYKTWPALHAAMLHRYARLRAVLRMGPPTVRVRRERRELPAADG